ncbi:MAG TPA: hypothetical protein VG711_05200 [Phycisphaerales bacterium]|nr:hypothetical protein [Phycisphaerales bacterium]
MTRNVLMSGATIAVTGLMFGTNCQAGPLKKGHVAPDSTWVVHVDVEAGLKSQLGQWVQAHEKELDLDLDDIDELKQQVGIDLRKDLKDFTAYGIGNPHEDHDAVIVATTTSAIDDAITALKGQMVDAFSTVNAGGYSLESVKNDDEELFYYIKPGTQTDERIVVLGHDMERVVKGVALVEGRAAKAEQSAALSKSPRAGSVLFVSATGLPWFDDEDGDEDAHAKIVQRSKGLVIDCGENSGQVFMEGTMLTATPEDAQDMKAMADGLLALGRMAMREDEDMKSLMDIARTVKIDVQGNGVRVVFEKPTSEITNLLEQAMAKAHADDAEEEPADDNDAGHAEKPVEEHKDVKMKNAGGISIELKENQGGTLNRLKGLAELMNIAQAQAGTHAKTSNSHFALSLGMSMKYETGRPSLELILEHLGEKD